MSDPVLADKQENDQVVKRPKRWRWLRILLGSVVFLVALLFWLNGPGIRWLGPKVASHFMERAGLTGGFRLEGSIIGGLSVSDVDIAGAEGVVKKITLARATPEYEFMRLIKGEVLGLTVRDLHAEIRTGLKKDEIEEDKPLDLPELVRTIREARLKIIPLNIDLQRISLTTERDGKPEFTLEPTDIIHTPGSDTITLRIGKMTAPQNLTLPPQESALVWTTEQLSLEKLDPYPGIGIRDLVVDLPEDGDPAARAQLMVDEAEFDLETGPGFSAATLALTSGALQVEKTAASFGAELPAKARLTSFSLNIEGILPDPLAATGHTQIGLENVAYEDWNASEVAIGATLEPEKVGLAVTVQALGSPVELTADAPLSRINGNFLLGETTGTLGVANIPALLGELSKRYPAIKVEEPVPESSLEGDFKVAFDAQNKPVAAEAALLLKPQDETQATPVRITGHWAPDAPVSGTLDLDGLKAAGRYEITTKKYDATLELENFSNARIDRWLAIGGVKLGGQAGASATWAGGGDLTAGTHRGEMIIGAAEWIQPEQPPVNAKGAVSYEWPGKVDVSALEVKTQEQTILLNAGLGDGLLELKSFKWTDGDTEMAEGSAKLPVPEDFSKWKETLANDKRPVDVSIESKVLSLASLKPWLPQASQLDEKSTGQVKIKIAGSYASPEVDLALDLINLRTPDNPKVPPSDLKLTIKGNGGKMVLDGTVTTPDYNPVVIKAAMPFKPAEWAENPGAIKEEPVEARLDLPQLDLSRFTSLVPSLKQLTGVLTGNVVVAGQVGKPELKGSLNLANGGVILAEGDFPPITGVAADVDMTLQQVSVKTLRATVAGGSIQGGGTLALQDGKPGNIDFRLNASHLPLVRNDMMIVRSSADLRLQGPFEKAALTGNVGIVDSLFYRDIELLPIGTTSRGGLDAASLPKIDAAKTSPAAGVPAPFGDWTLNVLVKTNDPFLIRGNLGTGDVEVNVKVGGTVAAPAPDGTVRIREGVAVLPFSTLKVPRGIIRFTPETGLDPILEIRGFAEPRPYRVDVYVHGRASDPQLVLTSNPPLPEHEIMTLLATGTTSAGLENTQAASSRALQLLFEEMRRGRLPFARQLRPVMKVLDRVDFNLAESDPYDGDSFSTATIALTNRWYISAGMGESGDTRFLGIWRLSFR
jgi:hypothetical protein